MREQQKKWIPAKEQLGTGGGRRGKGGQGRTVFTQKAEEQEVRAAIGFQDEWKEMDGWMEGRKKVSLNLRVLSCVISQ